ncbi:uncharacterized protein Dwil_GK23246 [Drosophila willistoni]|uniref:Tetratricopeptide repeat protein 37 n=1 Tax=Drosophila willistoni TaxID=7260 RepID=B4NN34_DROWI|nr:tetratricopeptide repeat protein 37 [Drosophila willistoni]EDW85773.1 uncharacterized protein Dwil_GK23246 [Drosophila willistoni]
MSKESKALIKEIRETIKLAKYADAIHKCQRLLKSDPKNNAIAYLLLGAAYQNVDKSEAAKYLRNSIEHTEGPPTVALQGLANCAPSSELPEIYDKLMDLIPEKALEYMEKLYVLSTQDVKVAADCFEKFRNRVQNGSGSSHFSKIQEYLGRIWYSQDLVVAEDDNELYKTTMEALLKIFDETSQSALYKRYLKWLYKQKDYASCIRNACQMTITHPKDVYGYEWICKTYCENHDKPDADSELWMKELKEPIQSYAEQLLQLHSKSSLALLINAFDLYAKKDYIAARQLAQQAQESHPGYAITIKLLIRIYIKLGAHKMALLMWQEQDQRQSDLGYIECLSYEKDEEKLREAVELLERFEKTEENAKILARCLFKLGKLQQIKELPLDELTQAEYLLSPEEAIRIIGQPESFQQLLLCGKLYIKLENYSEALNCMLKATRLNPSAECFDYLGRIYQATRDLSRARKCFEKCLSLNPLAEQAVDALSFIYQQLEEEDLNEALLINTLGLLGSDQSSIRLQYKLGLHFLHVKKLDNAIQCFRLAIKHDPQCMVYWESLGDAYASRGSYNSAIRVFQHIMELVPDNSYALLQVAVIKTTIRMYPEAIEDFNQLLHQHPKYLPGLRGAAEAHIGLACNLKSQNLYGRAKQNLQMAVDYLQEAFLHSKEALSMVWLWRLTATVFVQTAQLPLSLANLDVAGKLAKWDEDVEEIAYLSRKDLMHLAKRFYFRALKLQQNTYLWYELAFANYLSAIYVPEEAKTYLDMASKVCKMAIKERGNRWQNWNLLGVIHMQASLENLPLSQHCFIQAVTLERKSYTAWTNLGALYIRLGNIKLANEAFKRAQQSSPMYPNAWIGQAMVAETIGELEEAFDLFRHCQQFEYQPEAALGFAHWVCNVLSDPQLSAKPHNRHAIQHMHADVSALDAINWYVQNEEREASVPALTFQGFLYARQHLYQQAIQSFTKACQLCEPGPDRDSLYTNLGYLYLKLDQPDKAVNALNAVAHATFKPIIGLALAYYRTNHLQESYSIYNTVLGQNDQKAATILVAMASMVYSFQGEADTKTLLYQCILKHAPIQAYYSGCALGVLHQDNELNQTIMSELNAYQTNENYCADLSYLTAHYYLINDGPRQALNYLQTRVRMFPHSAALRKVLLKFLLDYFPNDTSMIKPTSNMGLIALTLGHRSLEFSVKASEEAETTIFASQAVQPVDKTQSLKLVQRAIRLNPINQQARQLLAAYKVH